MKMMKIFFSVLAGLMLTANVATAQVEIAPSAVAECASIVLPQYYQPGITPILMMQALQQHCLEELIDEMAGAGMDATNEAMLVAGFFFYSTEWLNRMLQDTLMYIQEGCPVTGAQESVDI